MKNKKHERPPTLKKKLKKTKRELYYVLGVTAATLIRNIPLPLCMRLLGFLTENLAFLSPKTIKRAEANLEIAFGGNLSKQERKKIRKKMFKNLGYTFAEYLHLPHMPESAIKNIIRTDEGFEKIKNHIKAGRGVIGISGHIDNWEMLGAYMAMHMPITVVAREIYFEKFDRWINTVRRNRNVNVLYQQKSLRPLLRAIQNGHFIGILADQDIKRISGVFVDFFSRPAYTPSAPVQIAAKTGAPLFFFCLLRENRGHYLFAEGPIKMQKTGDPAADVIANTRAWTEIIEKVIRKHPEQWAWFHRRWKTRPEDLIRRNNGNGHAVNFKLSQRDPASKGVSP